MSETAPAKICVFCGQDCSDKPRVKDKQGRYVCKSCLEKRQRQTGAGGSPAAKSPRTNAGAGAGPISLSDMLDDSTSQAGRSTCPECGTLMRPGAVMCVTCGYNSEKGKSLKTKVMREKVKQTRSAPKLSISPGMLALGLLGLWVVMGLAVFVSHSLGVSLAFYALAGACSVTGFVLIEINAFRSGQTGWGILGLLQCIPFVGLVFLYYAAVCDSPRGKTFFWMGAAGGILWFVSGLAGVPNFMDEMSRARENRFGWVEPAPAPGQVVFLA